MFGSFIFYGCFRRISRYIKMIDLCSFHTEKILAYLCLADLPEFQSTRRTGLWSIVKGERIKRTPYTATSYMKEISNHIHGWVTLMTLTSLTLYTNIIMRKCNCNSIYTIRWSRDYHKGQWLSFLRTFSYIGLGWIMYCNRKMIKMFFEMQVFENLYTYILL
jgi:hypothetical protein